MLWILPAYDSSVSKLITNFKFFFYIYRVYIYIYIYISYAEATFSSCGAILPVCGSVFQVVVMIFNLRFNTNWTGRKIS